MAAVGGAAVEVEGGATDDGAGALALAGRAPVAPVTMSGGTVPAVCGGALAVGPSLHDTTESTSSPIRIPTGRAGRGLRTPAR